MKTQKNVLGSLLIGFAVLLTNCSNNANLIPGTLTLKASSTASNQIAKAPSAFDSDITITSAIVRIQNLVIQEYNPEGVDRNTNENNGYEDLHSKVSGDLKLAGPYTLDIFSGSALIDNVSLQVGVYKKVIFEFLPGTGNTHAISIGGFYNKNGVNVPFTLISDINSSLQLPLAGNGVTNTSGSTSSISIIFDINLWIHNLDFATADVKENAITISPNENNALYKAFVTAMLGNIGVENM